MKKAGSALTYNIFYLFIIVQKAGMHHQADSVEIEREEMEFGY